MVYLLVRIDWKQKKAYPIGTNNYDDNLKYTKEYRDNPGNYRIFDLDNYTTLDQEDLTIERDHVRIIKDKKDNKFKMVSIDHMESEDWIIATKNLVKAEKGFAQYDITATIALSLNCVKCDEELVFYYVSYEQDTKHRQVVYVEPHDCENLKRYDK